MRLLLGEDLPGWCGCGSCASLQVYLVRTGGRASALRVVGAPPVAAADADKEQMNKWLVTLNHYGMTKGQQGGDKSVESSPPLFQVTEQPKNLTVETLRTIPLKVVIGQAKFVYGLVFHV
ncbi:Uncharacterized protein Fot_07983 [Forsythia ovata]|uniref:Uncharacterized protein n=1 Tax=Forsythia ovata TaxID=205694 RepID=A0ABD1WXI4_9LAMI